MAEDIENIRRIKEKYEDWLLSLEGIVGIGVGRLEKGGLCIRAYVKRGTNLPKSFPEKLDGVELELKEVGDFIAYRP